MTDQMQGGLNLDLTYKAIRAAWEVLQELCDGKRHWTMSIPAQPSYDPDLIIGAALRGAKEAIESLHLALQSERIARREAEEKLAELQRMYEKEVTIVSKKLDEVEPRIAELEAKVPKEVVPNNDSGFCGQCPDCNFIVFRYFKCCPTCGSHLNWTKEEQG